MTPAVTVLTKARVSYQLHEYEHDPEAHSYGLEAAEKLGLDPARVCKTLIAGLDDGRLAVGILPVNSMLNMKLLAKAAKAKKAALADPQAAERATGYVMGGISPIGQKKRLASFIDVSATQWPTIYVSGGRRGLDLELAPADLIKLIGASAVPLV